MKTIINQIKKKLDLIVSKEIRKVNTKKRKIKDVFDQLNFIKNLTNIEPMAKEFTDCINVNLDKQKDLSESDKDIIGKELVEYSQSLIHKFTDNVMK